METEPQNYSQIMLHVSAEDQGAYSCAVLHNDVIHYSQEVQVKLTGNKRFTCVEGVYVCFLMCVCFIILRHMASCGHNGKLGAWDLLCCLGMALPVHSTSIYSMMQIASYYVLF